MKKVVKKFYKKIYNYFFFQFLKISFFPF